MESELQLIVPQVVVAGMQMSTVPPTHTDEVTSGASTRQTVIVTVPVPVQAGLVLLAIEYCRVTGPLNPAGAVYAMQVDGQAVPPPLQFCTTLAVPELGPDVIVRLAQLSTPQFVESFSSTGMLTVPPAQTVAVSATGVTRQRLTVTVPVSTQPGVPLLATEYVKLTELPAALAGAV
jgi:hypothetical protein